MTTSQEQSSNQKDGNDEKPVAEVPARVVDSPQGTESLAPKTLTKVDITESLRELKAIIETATSYEEELSDLLERCHATVEQFEEHAAVAQQEVELQELHDVINSAKDVAKLCNEDSPFWRVGHRFKISNELRSLEARTVSSREPVDKPNTARRHPPGAKLPVGAPRIHAWHIERTEIIDAVCNQLGASSGTDSGDEKACLVGIAGPPGSGKSIAASMAIARESVRASFTKGVLWLPAGPGAKDRLPLLMYRLAEMVYETVNKWKGKAPQVPDIGVDSEDGAAYVREAIGDDLHRFLMVVDDVWESDVLQELRSIGVSILYTTSSYLSIGKAPLRLNNVDIHEAEILLRGAAELEDDVNLPREAHKLAKRCGSSIMDLAFIGRWSVVRGRRDGRGWQKAIDLVVRAQKEENREAEGSTKPPWSIAVLRAGLDELARNEEIRVFYLSMGLMPKGFAFAVEDAAALQYGGYCPQEILKEVRRKVAILESMAIVAQQVGGMYRMHVSHAEFVREEIAKFPETYERTKVRWQEYVSTINALLSWPQDDLLLVQQTLGALDKDAGASVFDATIDTLGESDPRLPKALRRVAYIQWLSGNREAACSKWSRLLVIQENKQLDVEYPYSALTLYDIGLYLECLGREKEAETWFERALSIGEKQLGSNQLQLANRLHRLANRSVSMGRPDNAEALFRRALAIREVKLGHDDPDVATTLHGLGVCKLMLGKSRGAKGHLERVLTIYEKKLGAYHSEVGRVMYDLGRCASIDGRVEDAERLYRGALEIQTSVETTDSTLADILHALGGCMSEIGRIEEAEGLHRRALVIREKILPDDHLDVARAAYALGKCTLELGRVKEAEELCRHALVAIEKTMGSEHPAVADILHTLGVCAIVEERTTSGSELLKQALSIYQQQPSVDDSKVAHVTYDLGRCTSMAGQTKEAERFFRQTLEIEEGLRADRLEVATVSYALGGCVLIGGQLEEAEDLYRRASVIRVETLGTNHADVADALNALGNCVLLAGGRVIEAKTLFRRALDIKKEFLPPNDPEIQDINHALEMCKTESSELVDIEESKWGAGAICLC